MKLVLCDHLVISWKWYKRGETLKEGMHCVCYEVPLLYTDIKPSVTAKKG